MDSSIYITYAVPVFFAMIGIEFLFGLIKGTNNYRLNDSIAAISLGLISRLPPLLNLGVQGIVWTYVATNLNMQLMPKDSWVTWVIAFLFYDLCYYWMHRMSHEVKVLWASHVVHHQGEEFNLSTALRQTSSGWLWKWIFYIPLFMVGIPGEVFFTVAAINLLYQFWVHTEHIRTLGILEQVFITPSNHRIHHAQNPEYIDANYGGVFIIWDRLFGSFIPERDDLKPIYGTVKPLKSWNPIWANLEIYHQMIRDTIHTKSLKNKIKVWFSSTRWRPEDVFEKFPHTSNDLDNNAGNVQISLTASQSNRKSNKSNINSQDEVTFNSDDPNLRLLKYESLMWSACALFISHTQDEENGLEWNRINVSQLLSGCRLRIMAFFDNMALIQNHEKKKILNVEILTNFITDGYIV